MLHFNRLNFVASAHLINVRQLSQHFLFYDLLQHKHELPPILQVDIASTKVV
jgi:hypothetical protein